MCVCVSTCDLWGGGGVGGDVSGKMSAHAPVHKGGGRSKSCLYTPPSDHHSGCSCSPIVGHSSTSAHSPSCHNLGCLWTSPTCIGCSRPGGVHSPSTFTLKHADTCIILKHYRKKRTCHLSSDVDIFPSSSMRGRNDLSDSSSSSSVLSPRTLDVDAGVEEPDFSMLIKWIRDVNNIKSPTPASNKG